MTTPNRTAVALALALLTLLCFGRALGCGFVGFDDDLYVSGNPYLRDGLSARGVRWGLEAGLLFDSPHADYWAPLTVLSRLVDVQLFGMNPLGHHLTNLLLHALNAALLFLVMEAMTGAGWRSAFVAGFFALHPLRVESVAWVTERKDVLSGFFFILTLGAYVRYSRSPSRPRYLAVLLMFALGLMAKPMLVTLPFLLLLLDYWPLGRLGGEKSALRHLLLEKLPLLVLSGFSLLITYVPLVRRGQITDFSALSPQARVTNALHSYLAYVGKMFWPSPLAVVYPHPETHLPLWSVGTALLFLLGMTGLALRQLRLRPYLIVGWLWYLGMLLPVVGLVQSGAQAYADRYTYLPLIGLSLIVAWGATDALALWRWGRPALALLSLGWLLVLAVLTRRQLGYWQDSVTLFGHAVQVTSNNYLAENNLATALALRGEMGDAEAHYREAIRILPRYSQSYNNLGVLLAREGRLAEATALHEQALHIRADDADAHFNLGLLSARLGQGEVAAQHYAEALRINPGLASAQYNWGNLLAAAGRFSEAAEHYRAAVGLRPDDVEATNNLGLALAFSGRWGEAMGNYNRALELDPRHARARTNLGRALVAQGKLGEGVEEYLQVLREHPKDADAHFYLAEALAAQGQARSAIEHYEEALKIDPGHEEAARALAAARRREK